MLVCARGIIVVLDCYFHVWWTVGGDEGWSNSGGGGKGLSWGLNVCGVLFYLCCMYAVLLAELLCFAILYC